MTSEVEQSRPRSPGEPVELPLALDRLTVRLTRDQDVPAMAALFSEAFGGAWPPFAIAQPPS